jgi:hypothetical protein
MFTYASDLEGSGANGGCEWVRVVGSDVMDDSLPCSLKFHFDKEELAGIIVIKKFNSAGA